MPDWIIWTIATLTPAITAIWYLIEKRIIPARLEAAKRRQDIELETKARELSARLNEAKDEREFRQNQWESEKARLDSQIGYYQLLIDRKLAQLDKLEDMIEKLIRTVEQVKNEIRILSGVVGELRDRLK